MYCLFLIDNFIVLQNTLNVLLIHYISDNLNVHTFDSLSKSHPSYYIDKSDKTKTKKNKKTKIKELLGVFCVLFSTTRGKRGLKLSRVYGSPIIVAVVLVSCLICLSDLPFFSIS